MSETKDTNPKDAIGIKKVPFSTLPWTSIGEMGLAMMEGALKYGRHNYRAIGVRASVYFDAALRHLTSYWEGEDIDPVSNLPHLIKAMACCAILRDAERLGKLTDDRPPRHPDGWIDGLNAQAANLVDKFPNPPPPYTHGDKCCEQCSTCICQVHDLLNRTPNRHCPVHGQDL